VHGASRPIGCETQTQHVLYAVVLDIIDDQKTTRASSRAQHRSNVVASSDVLLLRRLALRILRSPSRPSRTIYPTPAFKLRYSRYVTPASKGSLLQHDSK
jgi:hypothetical protein